MAHGMKLVLHKYGDWAKAAIVLRGMANNLTPAFTAQLNADGEFVLETLKGHILVQDLKWQPLSPNTRKREGYLGDDFIYYDTGFMYDNLRVLKVNSRKNGASFFIGANRDVKYHTGDARYESSEEPLLRDVLVWMEYGTEKQPARPLFRPTWEEVKPVLQRHWKELLKAMTVNAGIKDYDELVVEGKK